MSPALLILEYAVVEIFTAPFTGVGEDENSQAASNPHSRPIIITVKAQI